ncbi:MAG: hypothetical protein DME98_10440 [Verrucomicrobia bacterium]|nr:MAG: hypothetical protein DME98_10440 [Verrucomicrobiota bacterium]
MKKQNILALALKPAIRVTESVGIGIVLMLTAAVIAMITPSAASASSPCPGPTATRLVTGLEGAMGSTVGPDGALYVTEGAAGRISRVDPQTGEKTTFASGLPPAVIGIGGAIDVAFIDNIAYVLVTLVSDLLLPPSGDIDGIYRVDGPDSFTVVAAIGQFNLDNPPIIPFPYFIHTGLQFKLETYRGGFLVSDSHLNRVLRVALDGEISVLIDFDNIVPTGLEVRGSTVYMAAAGPDPHLPQTGKVVSFDPRSPTATEVASDVPFLLDVEFGGGRLYALSHGTVDPNIDPSNAVPYTGALVKVNEDGTFTVIMDALDRPTSLEFIGNTAYFVTLTGEIWKIEGVSCPH